MLEGKMRLIVENYEKRQSERAISQGLILTKSRSMSIIHSTSFKSSDNIFDEGKCYMFIYKTRESRRNKFEEEGSCVTQVNETIEGRRVRLSERKANTNNLRRVHGVS